MLKECCEDKYFDLLLISEAERKALMRSYMITRYIVEENIFVVIFYKLLEQQMY